MIDDLNLLILRLRHLNQNCLEQGELDSLLTEAVARLISQRDYIRELQERIIVEKQEVDRYRTMWLEAY